ELGHLFGRLEAFGAAAAVVEVPTRNGRHERKERGRTFSDALRGCEIGNVCVEHARQRAVSPEQEVCELVRVAAGDRVEEEELEDLVVLKGVETFFAEPPPEATAVPRVQVLGGGAAHQRPPSSASVKSARSIFACSASVLILSSAIGIGRRRPRSQWLTDVNETPIRCASCSWVRPSWRRISFSNPGMFSSVIVLGLARGAAPAWRYSALYIQRRPPVDQPLGCARFRQPSVTGR